jgi:hypothetical protein
MIERADCHQLNQIDLLPCVHVHDVKMLFVLIYPVLKPEQVLKDPGNILRFSDFSFAVS